MKVSKPRSPVENFTIAYDKTSTGCTLREDWDTTRATVDISAKYVETPLPKKLHKGIARAASVQFLFSVDRRASRAAC